MITGDKSPEEEILNIKTEESRVQCGGHIMPEDGKIVEAVKAMKAMEVKAAPAVKAMKAMKA